MRAGSLSGSASCSGTITGSQKRRERSASGVPGPTWVMNALRSALSMTNLPEPSRDPHAHAFYMAGSGHGPRVGDRPEEYTSTVMALLHTEAILSPEGTSNARQHRL